MCAGSYTNRGEEVPLGVECALPCRDGSPLQCEAMPASTEIEACAAHPLGLAEAAADSE